MLMPRNDRQQPIGSVPTRQMCSCVVSTRLHVQSEQQLSTKKYISSSRNKLCPTHLKLWPIIHAPTIITNHYRNHHTVVVAIRPLIGQGIEVMISRSMRSNPQTPCYAGQATFKTGGTLLKSKTDDGLEFVPSYLVTLWKEAGV